MEAKCKQASEDMSALVKETGLLLVAACMFTHRDKVRLLGMLRKIRGVKGRKTK